MAFHKDATGADLHESKITVLASDPVSLSTVASIAGILVVDNQGRLWKANSTTAGDWTQASIGQVLTTKGDLLVRTATGYARIATGGAANNGKVLTVNDGVTEGVAWQPVPGGGGGAISVTKYSVSYTSFTGFGGNAGDISLFTLAAGGIIHGVKMKHTAQWTGMSSVQLSVGIVGNLAKYASAFEVATAPSNTDFQLSNGFFGENQALTTDVRLAALGSAALSGLSGGSIDVWVYTSTAV